MVTFMFPGSFFSEYETIDIYNGEKPPDHAKEIKNFIDNIKKFDKDDKYLGKWFAFYFTQRLDIGEGEDVFKGKENDFPGKYYIGKVYNPKEVKAMDTKFETLVANAESNKWPQLVQTRRNNWQPFKKNDKLIVL